MKRFGTRFSSLLMVLTLLLSMSVPAFADDEPAGDEGSTPTGDPVTAVLEGVTLDKPSETIYVRNGEALSSVKLTAEALPADFNGEITWSWESSDENIAVTPRNSDAMVNAFDVGSATVTATARSGDVEKAASCAISAVRDTVSSYNFSLSSLTVGETKDAGLSVTWASGEDSEKIAYSVSDTSVATVDASTGRVTGVKAGSATLTAVVDGETLTKGLTVTAAPTVTSYTLTPKTLSLTVGGTETLTASVSPANTGYTTTFTSENPAIATVGETSGKVTAKAVGTTSIRAELKKADGSVLESRSCAVTVKALSGNVSASANVGIDLSFKDIYDSISDVYARSGGSGSAILTFTALGNSDVGTIYTSANKTETVKNDAARTFALVESMVFEPKGKGTYNASYTVTGNVTISGVITITVTSANKNISIGLSSDVENYSFYEKASSGATGEDILSDALGAYGSIKFGSITSGSNSGTLYTDSSARSGTAVKSGTIVNKREVESLYFEVGKTSTYQIGYTAYTGTNGAGVVVSSGTLSIGENADSLQVNISLNNIDDYKFSANTASGTTAVAALRSAINANVNSWKYVRFDSKPSVDTCDGAIYTNSNMVNPVGTNFYLTSTELASLYFVPLQSGSYEIGYGVYSSAGSSALATGKLCITVSGLADGKDTLFYTTKKNSTLRFAEEDFEDWFAAQRGGKYHLEYVRFTEVKRSFGTLYDGGAKLTVGNGYNYYTADYYSSKTSSSRQLSDVSYAAPSGTGYQEVSFTCYGRISSSGSLVSNSGDLRIYVTADGVTDISYSYSGTAAVLFQENDFTSVYRSAMNVTTASPKFYIQLMDVPDTGTLYYNYNTSTGRGTELTSSNVDEYPFYVNGASGTNPVSKLAYVPSSHAEAFSIRYVAFSSSGEDLYAGRITFQGGAKEISLNVTDGYTFRVADLFSSSDNVLYVVFSQPLLGKLYLNYSNGRGTPLPNSTRLYTSSASDGAYPLTSLTYIPRSDTTGSIPLNYTAYTKNSSYSGEITMKIEKKTASSTFTDVTAADVGSWAANAIDFASKWGLVIGTGSNRFTPRDIMRRCDFVLILYRNAGSPVVSGEMPYTDVPADAYYYNSALWASKNNIMNGVVTGTSYRPEGAITRQDFTRILYNYAAATGGSLSGAANLSSYTDANQVADYARDAMAWAVGKGYINGTSTTVPTLEPASTATRAQIATLLHRYLTL